MPMPFQAQDLDTMQRRFQKALERVWRVTDPMPDRPGLHREHLFDFDSGLRLLISRDQLTGDKPEIHVSASWEYKDSHPKSFDEANKQVIAHYKLLGGKGIMHFLGFSANHIPHWIVEPES